MNPKTGSVSTPSEMRVWNTGDALNLEMDGKPKPIKPSAGKRSISKPEDRVAAPSVCDVA